jgi:threonine dehydrogenase-like Zn-dependent dehydrogenase
MSTHKAYVQAEGGAPTTIQTVPTPSPLIGQILVDVLATPILSYTSGVLGGNMFPLAHPLTPGIAAIGRIVAVGADSTVLKKDQLVFCNPSIRARDDISGGTSILQGWFGGMTSESMKLMQGPWRHGSWSEKLVVPTENVTPLDEQRLTQELGYAIPQLCWINEFLVPFGGFLAADFRPGSTVIVAPATGHFGGCAVQVALAMGARKVIAVGRNADALRNLEKLDANGRVTSVALTGEGEKDAIAIRSASSAGRGADVYVDFSPPQASNATHPQACISALKHGGQAILMGGVRSNISLNYAQLMINNIIVKGNFMYDVHAPSMIMGLIESGVLSLKGLNTKVFGFDELQNAIGFAEKHVGMADLTVLTPVVK